MAKAMRLLGRRPWFNSRLWYFSKRSREPTPISHAPFSSQEGGRAHYLGVGDPHMEPPFALFFDDTSEKHGLGTICDITLTSKLSRVKPKPDPFLDLIIPAGCVV